MRFVFRADANQKLGAGHVLRTLGIAEELLIRGLDVVYIGEVDSMKWLEIKLKALGINFYSKGFENFIPDKRKDILILDSYNLSPTNAYISREIWKAIISIFDPATPDYDCDLKIHPGPLKFTSSSEKVKILSGYKYIPIRSSLKLRKLVKEQGKLLQICVIGGGSDNTGFVPEVSRLLSKLQGDFRVKLFSQNLKFIVHGTRQSVFEIGENFDKFFPEFDLAFSTSSTTCLELIANGCAVGAVSATNNQYPYFKELTSSGLVAPVGKFVDGEWNLDLKVITSLVNMPDVRDLLTKVSSKKIDGKGSIRIVDEILKISG